MADKHNKRFLEDGERRFSYFAFISYKHKDKKWARWLQQHLENYRLPNRLIREREMPRRLSPVFRDETDLTGGKTVYNHIGDKLCSCKFLIVICTRNMKHDPQYIDFEIEQFLAAGNSPERIIPFIIDDPGESPETRLECFPPALQRLGDGRPLGITLDHSKKHDAILKLVAAMLDIELQSLRSHDQARRFKRIVGGLSAGLIIALAFGATVAWEMLNVKQAKLREQNVYAEDTYNRGDRHLAYKMAESVQQEVGFLMDEAIGEEADRIQTLASIRPKYDTLTHLERYTAGSRSMFDLSGEHALIITGNSVRKYDLEGNLVLQFDVSGIGQKIVDVSSDGVHAVVMTVNDGEWGTSLWLYDMETRQSLAKLATSRAYDVSDQARGNLSDVLDAAFSPDGSLCAAYCTGGYFNENTELPVYSTATGEKLFSVDGDLLGSHADGGQGAVVNDFEFISNTLLRWKNDHFNVYLSTETGEAVRSSVADIAQFEDWGLNTLSGRYVIDRDSESESTFVVADAAELSISTFENENALTCFWNMTFGGKYALLSWGDGCCDQIDIVDLENMQIAATSTGCEDFRGRYKEITCYEAEESGRLYVYAKKTLKGTWFRFDPKDGRCIEIDAAIGEAFASDYRLISCDSGMDLLISRDGSNARVYEISAETVRDYKLDEGFESFAAYAQLSAAQADAMIGVSGDMYSLFSLRNAGECLSEETVNSNSIHAVSAGGTAVVQTNGNKALIWRGNELAAELEMKDEIISANVTSGGSRIMICTEHELLVYNPDGELLDSLLAEDERSFVHAKMSRDGSRILLLSTENRSNTDDWYELQLYDGANLTVIAEVSEEILRVSYAEIDEIYDISPNGKYIAAVERVYVGDKYQRVITVWSAETGEKLGRTYNLSDLEGEIFDYNEETGLADVFTYACFGENNLLLAGASSGVWVFDAEEIKTICYLADADARTGLPMTFGEDYIIYPCDDVHIWNLRERALITSIPADLAGDDFISVDVPFSGCISFSADGRLMFVSDRTNARIFDTQNWEESGKMSNTPAEMLYLDMDSMIYANNEGLYRQELQVK